MADEHTRKLTETWIDYLSTNRAGFRTPKDFGNNADACIDALVRKAILATKPDISASDIDQTLKTTRLRHVDVVGAIDENIKKQYTALHDHWKKLSDEKRAQNWATTVDHWKFLVWRTAQAIALAVIVLATAYVAQRLGITLPFARIPPV